VDYPDIKIKLKENEKPVIILYKYRWLVLISFFLSCAATGAVQGSLSTTRKIIENIDPDLNQEVINYAKYSDLLIYLPANFLSVYLMDKKGLHACIGTGSIFMLIGSILRFFSSLNRNLWFWYFGHIVCLASGAFLKNPVTKLATNWFGDQERGIATSIGGVSSPIGLLISQTMILVMFDNDDKLP
jgi:sugar phosphate permease